jgi:hypothetical protein
MADTSGGLDVSDSVSRMDSRHGGRWLTPVSVLISLVLVGVFAWHLPYLYLKLNFQITAGGYLPVIAVFPLIVLLMINGLLRRARIGLSRGELTVVFCSLMVALSTMATVGVMMTSLPSPVHQASAANKFEEMFLWSIDERLLPYTIKDKELERVKGQFDDGLNWYYMGAPKFLPPERPQPAAGTTAPAAGQPPQQPAERTTVAFPWWRWVRRSDIGPQDRIAAYTDLAEEVKSRSGELGANVSAAMLEQIGVLKTNLQGVGPDDTAAYAERLRSAQARDAYVRLDDLIAHAWQVPAPERNELRKDIHRERELDAYLAIVQKPEDTQPWKFERVIASVLPGGAKRSWFGWTGPLIWWPLLLVLFIVLQFCVAALLRRQWVDHEKLLFPHVEILESVTEPGRGGTPGGALVRNRLMWVGFVFASALFLIEGIHAYIPAVPGFSLSQDLTLGPLLTSDPWTAIPAALDLHIFVIAIAFLLPAEISMSIWVFVLLDFAVRVYLKAIGKTYHVTEPVSGYLINGGTDQLSGLTVFILALMWGARRHIANVLRKAFLMGADVDDSQEPLPYFGAFWAMVLCSLGIIGWCYVMGMSWLLSILLFGLTFLGVLLITRLVAELGIVTGQFQDPTMPQYLIAGTIGYRTEPGSTWLGRLLHMTPTYATWGFLWPGLFYGLHTLPMVMTSERMYRHGPSRRRFTGFILLLTVGVMVVFAVRSVSIPYEEGAQHLKQGRATSANHTFNNCLCRDFIRKERMHKPFGPMWINAIVGVVVMGVLLLLRSLFYWWPLHPIGYVCAGLAGGVWASVLIGWVIKRAVLKYGGGKLFRNTIPLFVGLLVGHFVMAGIWMIVGVWLEASEPMEQIYSPIWWNANGR